MTSPTSPPAGEALNSLKRPSKWHIEASEDGEGSQSAVTPSIKKRLVRPKKIRRPEDTLIEDGISSPGAGPSSPRRHDPFDTRRSVSPTRKSFSHSPDTAPSTQLAQRERARKHLTRSHFTPHRKAHPPLTSSRSVYSYTRLNHIEEGTYGVVFRARCNDSGGIYALKKLKLEEEKGGFPITSLREVMALMVAGEHPNVVGVREVVVGDTLNQ
jgi:cell division cycle 2-like protein